MSAEMTIDELHLIYEKISIKDLLGMLLEKTKEYHEKLALVISKKSSNLIEENEFIKKQKLAKYALSRGFESNLIWEILGD